RTKILFRLTKDESKVLWGYGFNNNEYIEEKQCYSGIHYKEAIEKLKPATEQEVFDALNQQRIKLGLVKGATIKTHQGTFKLETDDVVYSNKYRNEGIYIKQDFGIWICMNGK